MADNWPDTWQSAVLEDCMEAIIDYRGKTPNKTLAGIPLVTAKIVKNGTINFNDLEYISPDDYDVWMRRGIPKSGDIVLTTEAPLGEIAQLDDTKIALAQRIITLRGKIGLLDNTFLKYLMQSDFVQHQLHARASGSTVQGIKQSELRRVRLLIPPQPEQEKIANILGSLDDKIELNRRMNETLEAMARAIFKSWFVDFDPVRAKANGQQPPGLSAEITALFPDSFEDSPLGDIPAGWSINPIGDSAQVVGGGTPNTKEPEFWEGGTIPFATPKDLSPLVSPFLLQTERKITEAGLKKVSSGQLPEGTVLLSSRAPVGYLAIAQMPVAINQGFIAMVCNKELPNYYVLLWANQNLDLIKGRANGTTFQEVSKQNFRPIPVLIPPASVLEAFMGIVEPIYQSVVSNLRQSQTLAEIRDTLLPKLLSGEICVGNLNNGGYSK